MIKSRISLGVAILSALLIALFLSSCAQNQPSMTEKKEKEAKQVVAIVNGEEITKKELVDELIKRYGKATLNDLIKRKLIEQEARKEGVTVTPEEIKEAMNKLEKQIGGKETLNLQLQNRNVSRADLEEDIKYNLLLKKLVIKNMIDPSDLKIFYDTELKPNGPFAEIWMIVVTDKSRAEAIVKELKAGASFEKLSRQYSMAATSNLGGTLPNGYIGIVGKKEVESGARLNNFIPPQLSKAIFTAKPGSIVGPIEISTQKGVTLYYIIKVEKIYKSFEDMKPIIEDILAARKANEYLSNLMRKAKIEVHLGEEKTTPESSSSSNSTTGKAEK